MVYKAVCVIKGDSPSVVGVVRFEQEADDRPTKIVGEIKGLAPGEHGFYVHEWGDLSRGCSSAGGYYNPIGKTQGGLKSKTGTIRAGADGVAKVEIVDNTLKLNGHHSIIGRSMVVHEKTNDSGKRTNEGRIGCGLIALASPK